MLVSQGGGALRLEWVSTAKRTRGGKVVNAKIQVWSTPFGAKKGGQSTLDIIKSTSL